MSDLTRYRRCEKCDGERLIPNHETNLIERCDCREGFLPDDSLQQIADEWVGSWQREIRELSPELAALLDALSQEDTP